MESKIPSTLRITVATMLILTILVFTPTIAAAPGGWPSQLGRPPLVNQVYQGDVSNDTFPWSKVETLNPKLYKRASNLYILLDCWNQRAFQTSLLDPSMKYFQTCDPNEAKEPDFDRRRSRKEVMRITARDRLNYMVKHFPPYAVALNDRFVPIIFGKLPKSFQDKFNEKLFKGKLKEDHRIGLQARPGNATAWQGLPHQAKGISLRLAQAINAAANYPDDDTLGKIEVMAGIRAMKAHKSEGYIPAIQAAWTAVGGRGINADAGRYMLYLSIFERVARRLSLDPHTKEKRQTTPPPSNPQNTLKQVYQGDKLVESTFWDRIQYLAKDLKKASQGKPAPQRFNFKDQLRHYPMPHDRSTNPAYYDQRDWENHVKETVEEQQRELLGEPEPNTINPPVDTPDAGPPNPKSHATGQSNPLNEPAGGQEQSGLAEPGSGASSPGTPTEHESPSLEQEYFQTELDQIIEDGRATTELDAKPVENWKSEDFTKYRELEERTSKWATWKNENRRASSEGHSSQGTQSEPVTQPGPEAVEEAEAFEALENSPYKNFGDQEWQQFQDVIEKASQSSEEHLGDLRPAPKDPYSGASSSKQVEQIEKYMQNRVERMKSLIQKASLEKLTDWEEKFDLEPREKPSLPEVSTEGSGPESSNTKSPQTEPGSEPGSEPGNSKPDPETSKPDPDASKPDSESENSKPDPDASKPDPEPETSKPNSEPKPESSKPEGSNPEGSKWKQGRPGEWSELEWDKPGPQVGQNGKVEGPIRPGFQETFPDTWTENEWAEFGRRIGELDREGRIPNIPPSEVSDSLYGPMSADKLPSGLRAWLKRQWLKIKTWSKNAWEMFRNALPINRGYTIPADVAKLPQLYPDIDFSSDGSAASLSRPGTPDSGTTPDISDGRTTPDTPPDTPPKAPANTPDNVPKQDAGETLRETSRRLFGETRTNTGLDGALDQIDGPTWIADKEAESVANDIGTRVADELLEAQDIIDLGTMPEAGLVAGDTGIMATEGALVSSEVASIAAERTALSGVGAAESGLELLGLSELPADVAIAASEMGATAGLAAAEGGLAVAGPIGLAVDAVITALGVALVPIISASVDPRKVHKFKNKWMDVDGDGIQELVRRYHDKTDESNPVWDHFAEQMNKADKSKKAGDVIKALFTGFMEFLNVVNEPITIHHAETANFIYEDEKYGQVHQRWYGAAIPTIQKFPHAEGKIANILLNWNDPAPDKVRRVWNWFAHIIEGHRDLCTKGGEIHLALAGRFHPAARGKVHVKYQFGRSAGTYCVESFAKVFLFPWAIADAFRGHTQTGGKFDGMLEVSGDLDGDGVDEFYRMKADPNAPGQNGKLTLWFDEIHDNNYHCNSHNNPTKACSEDRAMAEGEKKRRIVVAEDWKFDCNTKEFAIKNWPLTTWMEQNNVNPDMIYPLEFAQLVRNELLDSVGLSIRKPNTIEWHDMPSLPSSWPPDDGSTIIVPGIGCGVYQNVTFTHGRRIQDKFLPCKH